MKKVLAFALVAVLLTFSCFGAFAEISPTAPTQYKITVSYDGNGEADKSTNVAQHGDVVVFEAVEKDIFQGWSITGDYEIVEGSLDTPVIKIKAYSDIHAHALFLDTDEEPTDSEEPTTDKEEPTTDKEEPTTVGPTQAPAPTQGNTSTTSPVTGTNGSVVVFVGVIALAAAGIAVVSAKRVKK